MLKEHKVLVDFDKTERVQKNKIEGNFRYKEHLEIF